MNRFVYRIAIAAIIIIIATGCQNVKINEESTPQDNSDVEDTILVVSDTQPNDNEKMIEEEITEDDIIEEEQVTSEEESISTVIPHISVVEENSNDIWNAKLMGLVAEEPIRELGFLGKTSQVKWYVEISNTSDVTYKNIKIDYTVRAYKHDVVFGIDYADVTSYNLQLFSEFSNSITLDILDVGESMEYDLAYLGTIPYIEIGIDDVSMDGTSLELELPSIEYMYPEFDYLADSQHLRELLGVNYLLEELKND